MDQLRFRQIHLDFHTSEAIPGIGKEWDKAHFQEMLTLGHVDSINIFAKCHHGWSYYPTKVPLSAMHPHLDFDLLGAMIDAAHEIDVKTPIYISAGLDEKVARTHAHWLRRTADGGTTWAGWLQAGYHEFCMRSPYLDYLIEQTEEIMRNYDGDGVWLDIVGPRDCVCQYCVEELVKRGRDPRDHQAVVALGRETYLNYARRINAAINAIKPGSLIFHNGGHIIRGDRELTDLDTHIELESLPTFVHYGYDHFPLSARYAQTLGKEFLGMTGKFHTWWGEFGGYKHPNALRYESAITVANGGKMCVGDQMHPFGKLDKATYALIGTAYREIEAVEPWCQGVTSMADVAILTSQAITGLDPAHFSFSANPGDTGALRVLQEGKLLYDVIDTQADFGKYRVIILPDDIPPQPALVAKLSAFQHQGGKLFVTGASLLNEDGTFAIDLGATVQGDSPTNPCYLVPRFPLEHWETAAFVMYGNAKSLAVTHGTVLADRQDAFFNRDYLHFCSHQHAPNTQETAGPAMVQTANTVYLAYPAFQLYAKHGQNVLRDIILHGLRQLLPQPTLVTNLPAQGVQTVMRQENRTVVHLVYGTPVKRGQEGIGVIEDLLPVRDTTLALQVDTTPNRVYLAPQQTDLPYTIEDGVLHATVPEFTCHQMVVIE